MDPEPTAGVREQSDTPRGDGSGPVLQVAGEEAASVPQAAGEEAASVPQEAAEEEASVPQEAAVQAAWLTRNAVDCLPEGALAAKLTRGERPLRVKLGIDPTAPDIHLGFTVVLQKLREFQDLGHTVVLIIGDYTARVGDPSGRSSTRPVLDPQTIDANARTFQEQALKILSPDHLEVRFNSEWLDMGMSDLFALLRTTTVAQVLERDDFAKRFAAQQPISVLELLYPLLQGYDSVMVDADVELGGTDQKFNLLLGRDIQRAYGKPEQVILTLPLLTGTDGVQKMSKSLGNYIGVTEPPEEIYGKTLSIPDSSLPAWYSLLLGGDPPPELGPRDAKRALARRLVARFHGPDAAQAAEQAFDRLHVDHKPPDQLDELEWKLGGGNGAGASTGEAEGADGTREPGGGGVAQVHLPAVLRAAFGVSSSEARRAIAQGGVRIDGDPIPAGRLDVDPASIDGRVLQLGKRRFVRVRLI